MITLLVFQGTPVKPQNWRELVKAQLAGQPLPAPAYPGQGNWKYTISKHGFTDGGNRLPAPSFASSRNPTCQNCGRRQRTWEGGPEKCSCEEPAFDSTQDTVSDRQKFQDWCVTWLAECFRVLRSGGVIKVFGATRMMHRMAAAMEEAGFVLDPEHSLEGWSYGCLSADAEILTETGWRPGLEILDVGTKVQTWDPVSGALRFQAVEELTREPFDGDLIRICNERTDQLLTPNHRIYYRREPTDPWEWDEAANLIGTSLYLPSPDGMDIKVGWNDWSEEPYEGRVWCIRVSTGAFVARRNGLAFVTGNSGFPKSLNIGKALDKNRGTDGDTETAIQTYLREQREAKGLTKAAVDKVVFGGTTRYSWVEGRGGERSDEAYLPTPEEWVKLKAVLDLDDRYDAYIKAAIPSRADRFRADGGKAKVVGEEPGDWGYQQDGERWDGIRRLTRPASPEAAQFEGFGTALKPAWEVFLIGRKPA